MADNITVPISSLLLDTQNPRYEPTTNQLNAIKALVNEQDRKLLNLAIDIIENGTDPSSLLIVIKDTETTDKYIVLEGNRRIAAIKLLTEPDTVNQIESDYIKNKFRELSENFREQIPTEISCSLFATREAAEYWISLRHTGENDGVGIVTWNASQVQRFNAHLGSSPKFSHQAIEFLVSNNYITREDAKNIKSTNLQRLLDDPDVRKAIGWTVQDGTLLTNTNQDEAGTKLMVIVNDLIDDAINVNNIYYKQNRREYIESIQEKLDRVESEFMTSGDIHVSSQNQELNSEKVDASQEPLAPAQTNEEKPKQNSKLKIRPTSRSRDELIPKSFRLKIDQLRINDIYNELRKINVGQHPNAVAVLFRVFLETSIDHYADLKKINGYNVDFKLPRKVDLALAELKKENRLDKHQALAIDKACDNQDSIASIETFNQYVHNRHFPPNPDTLKVTWDQLQLLFEAIWA